MDIINNVMSNERAYIEYTIVPNIMKDYILNDANVYLLTLERKLILREEIRAELRCLKGIALAFATRYAMSL